MGYNPWGHKQLDMTEKLTYYGAVASVDISYFEIISNSFIRKYVYLF